ncbi:MAG: PAS domain S-box protein [Actinomycetota bacterium]|nr:PAS domain S-box protein [Actinomycetota bacterium]
MDLEALPGHSSPPEPPSPSGQGRVFEALVARAPDGIVVIDESGRITVVNERLCELFGYRADELVGRPVEILVPARFQPVHIEHRLGYRAHPATRPMGAGLALVGRRKGGDEFPVDVSLSSIGEAGGRILATAFVRDITARRRAEQELHRSEERFRLLVEGVADHAIFMLDPSGHVVTWNDGAERIKGWRPAAILGRHFSVFYRPQDVAAGVPDQHLAQAASEGKHHSEGWRIRADGTSFWAEATLTAIRENGTLRGFAKITRDRTEARLGQTLLEAVNALSRAVLDERSEAELLRLAVQQARTLVGATAAWICLPDDRDDIDGAFVVAAADGEEAASILATGAAMPVCASVAQTGIAEVVADWDRDPATAGLARLGLGFAAFVPLAAAGERLGVLVVAVTGDRPPLAAAQVDVVRLFAIQAAVALGYRRAREQLGQLLLVSDRERIARDLHDSVIQRLFAVGLTLEAAVRLPRADIGDRLRQAVTDIDDTIRSIRTSIFGLELRAEQAPGLRRQILDLTAESSPGLGFEPSVRFTGPVDSLATGNAAEQLLAVMREALSNIARHAHAHHVDVTVDAGHDFTLTVDDDGIGFVGESPDGGHGLKNMAVRAEQLGGAFIVQRRQPAGTRLTWRVPRQVSGPGEGDLRS